jgi:hypothetical protein
MLDRWMAAVGPLMLLSVLPAIVVLMRYEVGRFGEG